MKIVGKCRECKCEYDLSRLIDNDVCSWKCYNVDQDKRFEVTRKQLEEKK